MPNRQCYQKHSRNRFAARRDGRLQFQVEKVGSATSIPGSNQCPLRCERINSTGGINGGRSQSLSTNFGEASR